MSLPIRNGPPTRHVTRNARRKQILAFVEGRQTEERYLVDWYRRYRKQIILNIDPFRGVPLSLVNRAVARSREDKQDEKRGQGPGYDEIWCVFDVDNHPDIATAVNIARDHNIYLAISNPCLELWFILHFQDQTAWIDRWLAQAASKALLNCEKVLTDNALDALFAGHTDAICRARLLEQRHIDNGSPPSENPGSGAWQLINSIIGGQLNP